MRCRSWVGVTAMCLALFGSSVTAEAGRCARLKIPSSMQMPPGFDRVIERIYDRSATFRAQYDRVASQPRLTIRIFLNTRLPSYCRALTRVERHGLAIRADINLPPSSDYSELLAHEFEHVLEQIEGVNLRELARVRGSGIYQVEARLYESERAQNAGRVVAAEMRKAEMREGD